MTEERKHEIIQYYDITANLTKHDNISIYLGRDILDDRSVLVKQTASHSDQKNYKIDAENEINILSKLRNCNRIVQLLNYFWTDFCCQIVTEVYGFDLENIFKSDGRFS